MSLNANFGGEIGRTHAESTPWWPPAKHPGDEAPNVVVVLFDDLGFSHLNCFGSDMVTPNIDKLASNGLRVIDDSYNANPTSVCAAIDILAGFAGRRVLVLGDIGELGEWAEQGHRQVGQHAIGKVDALYAVGPLMAHAVAEFGTAGRHFSDQASLIAALQGEQGDTTVLIKGSRSAAMEKVVAALCGTSGEIH